MDERRNVARAARRMSAATLISRILGYVRDMIFGALFGSGLVMDAYLVAFRIPNLFREIFAEGSMSAAFVPVLTETRHRHGEEEARRLVRITTAFILTAVGGLCLAGILFAPAIVTMMAPGFLDDPEKFRTTVLLTRVVFPFLLFVSLAAMTMGSLNTKGVFFLPALAPAALNVVSIAAVLLLVSRIEPPIIAVAVGTALGGVVQFLIQVPSFHREGFSLSPVFRFGHPGLRKMFFLVIPVILSMSTSQVNIFVNNILASFLAEGSITYLYYAMRLIQFPIGIFGVAMSTAVLPSLSRLHLAGDTEGLRETVSFALRLLFFLTLPAMAGLILLREPIVAVLFQHGKFGPEATRGTALALLCYAVGIWSTVGTRVVAATFYSMQDSKTPVKMAMLGVGANVLLSLSLMPVLGHAGLALAASLASSLQFFLLLHFLRRKIGRIDGRRIAATLARIGVLSAVMGGIGVLLFSGYDWLAPGASGPKAIRLFGGIVVLVAFYLGANRLMGGDEMSHMIKWRRRKAG